MALPAVASESSAREIPTAFQGKTLSRNAAAPELPQSPAARWLRNQVGPTSVRLRRATRTSAIPSWGALNAPLEACRDARRSSTGTKPLEPIFLIRRVRSVRSKRIPGSARAKQSAAWAAAVAVAMPRTSRASPSTRLALLVALLPFLVSDGTGEMAGVEHGSPDARRLAAAGTKARPCKQDTTPQVVPTLISCRAWTLAECIARERCTYQLPGPSRLRGSAAVCFLPGRWPKPYMPGTF